MTFRWNASICRRKNFFVQLFWNRWVHLRGELLTPHIFLKFFSSEIRRNFLPFPWYSLQISGWGTSFFSYTPMHSFRFLRISVRNSGVQYHGKLSPYLRFLNYQLHKYDPAAFVFPNQLLTKYEVVRYIYMKYYHTVFCINLTHISVRKSPV